jgi:hypothetical protein
VAIGFLGSILALMSSCMFGSRFLDESLTGNFWVLAAICVWLRADLNRSQRERPVRRVVTAEAAP